MRNTTFLFCISMAFIVYSSGCKEDRSSIISNYQIPIVNHDVGYIPYDSNFDKPDYLVCDSTQIASGRNRIQYEGGTKMLKKNILSNYISKREYKSFSGFVVIRFLVNCQGKSGRYRAQALNLDFSTTSAPFDLLTTSLNLVKSFDHWNKSSQKEITSEYLKFINLRFKNGEIEHLLL